MFNQLKSIKMLNFYFWDKSYSQGCCRREVTIKVNDIITVLTQESDYNWKIYFYDSRFSDLEKYIVDYSISENLALNIIKEAKEYQSFLYDRSSY